MTAKIDKDALQGFFQDQVEEVSSGGIIIPETSFDVLADLKGGKFKDGAGESLGEEMPMFILDYKQRWGVAPWDKADENGDEPKPQHYGEVWIVPVGGKLGESRMVCRLLKKAAQFRLLAASVARCMAERTHYRAQVWIPRFESKLNEYGQYYAMKFSHRDPSEDLEWEVLQGIKTLLEEDKDLSQLRDDSTGLLYLQDLTAEQRKAVLLQQNVIKPALPELPTAPVATPALPAAGGYEPGQF